MKILVLNHNQRGHGTYHRAWPIARGLAKRGWEVVFATVSPRRLYRTDICEEEGVRVYETPCWTWPGLEADDGWGPLGVLVRMEIFRREKFDWIYSFAHTPNCAWPALWGLRHTKSRLAVDWCDDFGGGVFPQREALRAVSPRRRPVKWAIQRFTERAEGREERVILQKAEKITVIGQELFDKARTFGVPPERIRLVRSGGDLDFFRPRNGAEARRALGLPLESPLLVYAANYHPDELFLLDSLERVFACCPDARLAYTGPVFQDPRAGAAPFLSRLIHLGHLPWEQIPILIASGDAALLPMADTPHNRARCPQKLMDYLASGRPVAACAVGETGSIFGQYPQIGAASQPASGPYAEAILGLLNASPEDRDLMGRHAREAAESEFNWERATEAVDGFLKESG